MPKELGINPGEGPASLIFRPKMRPEEPRKIFLRPPPLPLSQGLDDPPPPPSIRRSGSVIVIKPYSHARNTGAIFDTTTSMLPHVNNVYKSAFYHLRTISRIRKQLSTQTIEILLHTFVTSKLDHCNSLIYVPKNVIKKLQSAQNAPARLITHSRKSDHIIPTLFHPFTGYLFLNELNSRFYYLPSRLCISNLQPTFNI